MGLTLISKKSELAEAIHYALSRWAGLSLFLDDGRVEIDSKGASVRSDPCPDSQAALFAGWDEGGRH